MPKYIAEFGGLYCEWSTITDSPVTYLVTKEELREYIKEEYGKQGLLDLDKRLARVAKTGCSCLLGTTKKDLLKCNRAGENETRIKTETEMVKRYTL